MIDKLVLELAGRQFGVVGRRQLTDSNVSGDAIYRARKRGLLIDVLPDVYRIASSPETFDARCIAVQLHAPTEGFLSGFTAGRLHGLRKMPENLIHYTVPRSSRVRFPGWVHLHRTSWYHGHDDRQTMPDGRIVATPMRMLFGLAAMFNRFRFERAVEDAWHLKLITPTDAFDYLQAHRCRGKDGVLRIEQWLEKAVGYNAAAQSELERTVLQEIERVGLATPVRQHRLVIPSGETIHLDIAWPDIRLAIEPGSSWFHGGDEKMAKDQARDRACVEIGWIVVRFTESMRHDLRAAVQEIRRIRARRIRDLTTNLPEIGPD